MKILLVAVNAKYIHSNLAVYSLKAYADKYVSYRGLQTEIAEYTINWQTDAALADIYQRQPDVVCFSCYIWNLTFVEEIVKETARILPDADIWAGGPEVSYNAGEVLSRLPQIKGIMKGEGEAGFAEICGIYAKEGRAGASLAKVKGITYRRESGEICDNPWREPEDLDKIPFVYRNFKDFSNKILYYETSRGCPFSCSYCLSSVDRRLRFRSLCLVREELQFFIDHRVPQVKFVDRTFNCRHEHAMAIWKYLAEHDNGVTNFHFEVSADLLNEEELALIETMRPGLIQLEIGVQSANPRTLQEIRRTMDLEKVKAHVARIRQRGNVHQHLDLIAGLPYEDKESFARSFDEVYRLKPDQLQLGFLKVLKGSFMEEQKEKYGLVHKAAPPYEVLYTRWLSYADVRELKGVEEMVEVYYNSGQFAHSLTALEEEYTSAFQMFLALWRYYRDRGELSVQHKRSARYEIFLGFVRETVPRREAQMREWLTYDYYLRENAKTRPAFAGEYRVDKEFLRRFYEEEARTHRYLPGYAAYDKKQMRRMTHIEYFPVMGELLLFDYMCRNPLNQSARTCMIKGSV